MSFLFVLLSYSGYFPLINSSVYAKNFSFLMLQVVYIFSAASSLVQCVVRIVGPERFAKCAKQLWAKTCCG